MLTISLERGNVIVGLQLAVLFRDVFVIVFHWSHNTHSVWPIRFFSYVSGYPLLEDTAHVFRQRLGLVDKACLKTWRHRSTTKSTSATLVRLRLAGGKTAMRHLER